MTYPRLAFLILPYTRHELPGWGYLFKAFKVSTIEHHSLWKSAPTKTIRHSWHNHLMKLDLSNWSERHTYFLGRFYDLDLQLAMNQVLKAGDRFVDIGANIGMITLHGAALVGDSGHVDSFEPNPECCKRIKEFLELNNIKHVQLHEVGLSDVRDTLTLSILHEHSGMGTLTLPSGIEDEVISQTFEVPVSIGDDILRENSKPIKFLKIDVEGFEYKVLRGLEQTLKTWKPVVVTEVSWKPVVNTEESNNSTDNVETNPLEIYQFMKRLGYLPYGLTTKRRWLRHHLALIPVAEDNIQDSIFSDFLWLHPESSGKEALKNFIS
ncbi:FkbM family methyltransferase [Mastigocoleus sp. MO_188.B34]|uniref:FkbM family methyltransferase n=1 Tax=Mastigocoleus sp. MO_188.B34 TaxID=3036635 RepID=UPI002605A924|nr:FkbM family methyltransferase [Mastigocoleus sp. MO_188.B34]MDJ0696193.1 FkbM family methyltransferase [Mastigocoleus sp. MO_188.B34]